MDVSTRVDQILLKQKEHAEERIQEHIKILAYHQEMVDKAKKVIETEGELIKQIEHLIDLPRAE